MTHPSDLQNNPSQNHNLHKNPPPKNKPLIVEVDPATLLAVIAASLLIPLLISGFIFQ